MELLVIQRTLRHGVAPGLGAAAADAVPAVAGVAHLALDGGIGIGAGCGDG